MPQRSNNKTLLSKSSKIQPKMLPSKCNKIRLQLLRQTALLLLTKLKIKHNWLTQMLLKLHKPTLAQVQMNLKL